MTLSKRPALILIDIQDGLIEVNNDWGHRNNPDAEDRASELLHFWREMSWPVYHIQHNSINPNSPLYPEKTTNAIQEKVKPLPHEPVLTKTVNSAFIGTELEMKLKKNGHLTIVICGLTTEHCVSTSTRMAGNLGFETFLAHDATAAYDKVDIYGDIIPAEVVHQTELSCLNGEFATVLSTAEVMEHLTPPLQA